MSRFLRLLLGASLLYCSLAAGSVERVSVCFNYGCLSQTEVEFSDGQLDELKNLLERAASPTEEREAIAEAVGRLLGWAGQQSPIAADRGGNYADEAIYGRMDCIDHSRTTTRLLQLIEKRGWLRFHRVLEPALRVRFLLFQHYSAQIEEIGPSETEVMPERFVVDSWFFDNGHPAAVMPLAAWMAGEGPDVTIENKGKTVVVGLSGGVDSSVAALLLKQQGWNVIGLFMKNWEDDDDDEYCSSRQDLIDVMSVADTIGVDVEVVNFAKEYRERVFSIFLEEYQAGRTPNPDVLCNSEIKFKAFLDHAMRMGADRIATGHYAGVREFDGIFELLKAEDGTKDQSYFLHRLNQQQLSKTLFPLADLYKRDVRKMAEDAGLHVAVKKDSTGICFIGERPFKEFLMRYLPPKKGEIRCLDDDRVMGEHDGLTYHTLGQRKGLQIGGVKGGKGSESGEHEAWFVAKKEMARNILYVVQGHDHPALLSEELKADQLTWISGKAPHTHWVYGAKTRYRQADAPCEIERVDAEGCQIRFAAPQWAVTPGQSVVVYESRVCLGGGVIL